jgi:hypothetical protein
MNSFRKDMGEFMKDDIITTNRESDRDIRIKHNLIVACFAIKRAVDEYGILACPENNLISDLDDFDCCVVELVDACIKDDFSYFDN